MIDIPAIALSVRQPWAYALGAGWKPVENRSWRRDNPSMKFRGPFAIHASMGMTRDEYESAADFMASQGFQCPAPADLLRGGIVGAGVITDVVRDMESDWFFGPVGLVVTEARTVDFIPVGGRLGFFNWRELLPVRKTDAPCPPAKWMLPRPEQPRSSPTAASKQGTLL